MKDFLIVCALLLLIAAGFYAFQILILGLVGLTIYWSLPIIRRINERTKKWK